MRRERVGSFQLDIMQTQGERPAQEDRFFAMPAIARDYRTIEESMKRFFAKAAQGTAKTEGGSTATVAYIGTDNILTVAHLGDSPVLLFEKDLRGHVVARRIIAPHRPADHEEESRITIEDGSIHRSKNAILRKDGKHVVYMSRAFGDHDYPGMGKIPTITQVDLTTYLKPLTQLFIAVGSDGILQRVSPYEHASIVEQCLQQNRGADIARLMKDYAARKRETENGPKIDNVTLLFTEIPSQRKEALIIGVLDGHGGKETVEAATEALQQELSKELGTQPGRDASGNVGR